MSMGAIFDTPTQLLRFMRKVAYKDFTVLMPAAEVGIYREGSCHDQTMFEYDCLCNMGIDPYAEFLMAVDKDNIGGETHTFVYWVDDGKAYWLENAWEEYRGIHVFDTVPELIDAVVDAFKARNPRNYIYISDFYPFDHNAGEDLDTFVGICMTNAKLV